MEEGKNTFQFERFHLGRLEFNPRNIEGEIEVNGEKLEKRDALGIWETPELEIKATTNARFLVMEIPMKQ